MKKNGLVFWCILCYQNNVTDTPAQPAPLLEDPALISDRAVGGASAAGPPTGLAPLATFPPCAHFPRRAHLCVRRASSAGFSIAAWCHRRGLFLPAWPMTQSDFPEFRAEFLSRSGGRGGLQLLGLSQLTKSAIYVGKPVCPFPSSPDMPCSHTEEGELQMTQTPMTALKVSFSPKEDGVACL